MTRSGSLGVAVIGCGLIGRRRAEVVSRLAGANLVVVADADEARARALADEMNCLAVANWQEAIGRDDVAAVVVSTSNNWLAPITLAALQHGKHVLVEKPMARTLDEAEAIARAVGGQSTDDATPEGPAGGTAPRLVAKVGFNHRLHPAVRKAHDLFSQGAIGDIAFIRCRYGHGGRPGYEKEWRMDREIAGGGELLDQGIHAIDLFRWFLGEFDEASGFIATSVWRRTAPGGLDDHGVEDNAFALFRTPAGQVASLHASWTQWKNLFSFEVFGQDGYLVVEGLGRSYGPERLRVGRRSEVGGAPAEEVIDFPEDDTSWEVEWQDFVAAIQEHREPLASSYDGWRAFRMAEAVYESARTGRVVRI